MTGKNWVEPRNWVKLGVKIGNVRVVLNLGVVPSVVVHPGQMKGFNVDELEMDAARVVERSRMVLEYRFGMLLSDVGEPLGKPRFRVYRPECHAWIEAGKVQVNGDWALDASSTHDRLDVLSGRPHLEYENKRYAAIAASFPVAYDLVKNLGRAAVDFPLTLERLDSKVDFLCSQIAVLVEANLENKRLIQGLVAANERLVEALSKLFGLDAAELKGEGERPKVPGNGVGVYVS